MSTFHPLACPECGAGYGDIVWAGGSPPFGPEWWDCLRCGHGWETPPVAVWRGTNVVRVNQR